MTFSALQEAIETMVACSAMAMAKSVAEMGHESPTKESHWAKWKRGGIIGAAALTGGTLMAITGGTWSLNFSILSCIRTTKDSRKICSSLMFSIISKEILFLFSGLAAPAIAAGFGALAPTLGTIIPVIGASGFAAAASAAGTVAGSVAVAASFGGKIIHKKLEVITSYRVEVGV